MEDRARGIGAKQEHNVPCSLTVQASSVSDSNPHVQHFRIDSGIRH